MELIEERASRPHTLEVSGSIHLSVSAPNLTRSESDCSLSQYGSRSGEITPPVLEICCTALGTNRSPSSVQERTFHSDLEDQESSYIIYDHMSNAPAPPAPPTLNDSTSSLNLSEIESL